MESTQLWPLVDFDFLKSLMVIHNEITTNRKDEEFDSFVLSNRDKINHPDYLQVFAQRVVVSETYFKRHREVCLIFFNLMQDNPGWVKEDFDFGVFVRLGTFEDSFRAFLESR